MKSTREMEVNLAWLLRTKNPVDPDASRIPTIALVLAYMDLVPASMRKGEIELQSPSFLPALDYLDISEKKAEKSGLEDVFLRILRVCSEWQGLNEHLRGILDPIFSFPHWDSQSAASLCQICKAIKEYRDSTDRLTYAGFLRKLILQIPDLYRNTPDALVSLIYMLVREYAMRFKGHRVYDPFCQSASLLVPFASEGSMDVYGEEMNIYSAAIARLKMRILSRADSIHVTDAITAPSFVAEGRLEQFDFVVSHLPFGLIRNDWHLETDEYNRFESGMPTRNSAEWPFLSHMLSQTRNNNGIVIAIVSPSVLFRTGVASDLRKRISIDNTLEAVVHMPAGLLSPSTFVAPVLLILRKGRSSRHVRFIDASEMGRKDKRQVTLFAPDVEHICELILSEKEEPGEARSVTLDEIAEHGYSWQVSNYVTRAALPQEKADPTQLAEDIHRLRAAIADKQARLDALLADWNNQ